MSLTDDKINLRKKIKKIRNDIDMSSYRSLCSAITERLFLLREYRTAERIHCYVSSLGNEVDTLAIILDLLDKGKTVAVPKCDHERRKLSSIRIRSLDDLKPSRYGLMEPADNPAAIIHPAQLDLVIAPLVAFDRTGLRLGMGGGFYDSLMKECRCPVVGLAYSFQEAEDIPSEPHDMKLDIVITDKEVIRFSHD